MLWKMVSGMVCLGAFAGAVYSWFALQAIGPSGNITDTTNMFLPMFQKIGCEVGCIKFIQPICWVLFVIGGFWFWQCLRNGTREN